jgi:hypothetical protein
VNRRELRQILQEDKPSTTESSVKTVCEDGFVREIVSAEVDPETGQLLLRLEIQKKNGEIE